MRLEGQDQVQGELEKTKSNLEKVQSALRIAGVAFTAVGVAGLKMVSDARKMNAQLGQTALTLDISTKEMRSLALATTDVTFPLSSVASTFELLARAGVRSTEEMQKSAKAFDALADATGSSAEVIADMLLPAFKLFGEKIPTTSQELDKFTWMTKRTLVDLSDFGTLLTRVAPHMDTLDMSMDDAVATLAALGEKGITGTAATLKLRTAITQAASSGEDLNTILGISQEEIDGFRKQMSGAVGITDGYAKVANEQFGIMAKIKQKFEELSLVAGSFLAPLESILGVMTALGPVLIFASTGMGLKAAMTAKTTIALIAHKIAVIASTIASIGLIAVTIGLSAAFAAMSAAIMSIPVFGWIAAGITAAIALGILLWKNWDKVVVFFKQAWESIKMFFLRGIYSILDGLSKFTKFIPGLNSLVDSAKEKISNMINAEEVKQGAKELIKASNERIKALREEKDQIDKKHEAEINAINEEWGDYKEIADFKIQQAKKVQEVESRELDKRITEAKRANTELLNLDKKYREDVLEVLDARMADWRADIERRRNLAEDEYAGAVKRINEEYGEYKEVEGLKTASLADQARERARITKEGYDKDIDIARGAYDETVRVAKEAYNKEIDAARKVHNEKIRLLDVEMASRLAAYDTEVSGQVEAIQKQIEAIDRQTAVEDLAMTRAGEAEKLANLASVINSAKTEGKRAEAQKKYDEYATEIARKELLRQRQNQKESLRDEIEQIRRNAKIGRDALETQLETEYDKKREAAEKVYNEITLPELEKAYNAQKEAADKIYNEITLPDLRKSIAIRKTEVDKALETELKDIEQQRKDALVIEGLKYTNPNKTGIFDLLDKEEEERKQFFKDQLEATALQISDINKAYEKLQKQYDIRITTHYESVYTSGGGKGVGGAPKKGVGKSAVWAQHGFHGIVDRPMIFGVGEAGAERVDITPVSKGSIAGLGVIVTGNTFYVRQESDIDAIAGKIVDKIRLKTGVRI